MALVKFEKRIAFEVRREGLQIVTCDIYRGQGGRYGFLRLTNYGNVQARSAVFVIRTYDADKNPLNKFAVKLTGLELEKHASVDYDFPIPLDEEVAGFNFALTSLNGSSSFAKTTGKAPFEVKDVQATIEMVDPEGEQINMHVSTGEETPVASSESSAAPKAEAPIVSDEEDDGGDTFEADGEDDYVSPEDQLSNKASLAPLAQTASVSKPKAPMFRFIVLGAVAVAVIVAVVLAVVAPNILYGLFHS
ncbi:MAG: hypothetical protein K6F32_01290 [Bacilli bacterium]|nr:hypothetical protein [Bacilli bacterium]